MDAVLQHEHYKDVTAQTVKERVKEYILYRQKKRVLLLHAPANLVVT